MNYSIEKAEGGVTAPEGFRSASLHCGIKAKAGALDLAVLATDEPATAAGLFTTNLAKAAPVLVSQHHLTSTSGRARAVVVNSGCANACTGDDGMANAVRMTAETAAALGCAAEEVLVASTGVIGVGLKMDRVVPGIRTAAAALARETGADMARAIMTTDPFPKEAAAEIDSGRGTFRVGGIAKGSGMIEPNMATMLGFVTLDAAVAPALLQRALKAAVDDTFNAITVDGECSTNDCVFALANGASGVTLGDDDYPLLIEALRQVCEPLAVGIVRGGEGATKLVTVNVTGAASREDARRAAKAIANSLLVKTAIHGGDPNWGRLIAVAGRANVAFELSRAMVVIGSTVLFKNGQPHDEAAPEAAEYLKGTDILISVDLGAGSTSATVWTCDLSAEYVRINAEYRT